MVSFQVWLQVLAIAFNTANSELTDAPLTITTEWRQANEYGFYSGDTTKALLVSFSNGEDGPLLKAYLFLPPDNYILKSEAADQISIAQDFRFACHFALVYELFALQELNEAEQQMNEAIEDAVTSLFAAWEPDEIVFANDNFTLPSGLQIMSVNEYPFYVEVNAALPGSSGVDKQDIINAFHNKVVQLNLFPDIGPSQRHWIAENPPGLTIDTEKQLKLEAALNECAAGKSLQPLHPFRAMFCSSTAAEDESENAAELHKLCDCLHRLARIGAVLSGLPSATVFDVYTPTTREAGILDYRPELAEQLGRIPDASPENLSVLYEHFLQLTKVTPTHPGTWHEGNVILGAPEKEYIPSNAELLLDETASRLQTALNNAAAQIPEKIADALQDEQELEYVHFTFYHVDVMGSGRFIYVEKKEPQRIKWKDQ